MTTKSMTGQDGHRQLAAGAARAKQKSAGEPKKPSDQRSRGDSRTGSSKQRKG